MTERERLIELLYQVCEYVSNQRLECLADFLLENGVVALPCKFLQKCFVIPTADNSLSEITEMKSVGFSLSSCNYNANLITDKNKLYQPSFEAFGKTVFLTKEEAEQALNTFQNGKG